MNTLIPKSSKNARKFGETARFFETYRQISHLIGKTLEKAPKLLYNENRLRKPLVRCRFFACESEVIYVKHYRNQKHYKGI